MSKYLGKHVNNKGQEYEVLSVFVSHKPGRKQSFKVCRIKFLDTGSLVEIEASAISKGVVKDPLSPSVMGVAALGYVSPKDHQKAYDIWAGMLQRCYRESDFSYIKYGGMGVHVCDRWKRFDFFLEDLPKVDGYDEELFQKGLLVLDKDKKQLGLAKSNKIYSLETCTFLSAKENSDLRDYESRKKVFVGVSPSGDVYEVRGVREFAKQHGLNHSGILFCLQGKYSQHKGWKFKEKL